ncbi:MAG: ATP-binding protein [Oscillospiraceae bacterium]
MGGYMAEQHDKKILSLGKVALEGAAPGEIAAPLQACLDGDSPFALFCQILALNEGEALCAAACFYRLQEGEDSPTAEEANRLLRRFGGADELWELLFVFPEGHVELHPVALDYLEGRFPRLPSALELNKVAGPLCHGEDILEELNGFLDRCDSSEGPVALVLRGDTGSGRRHLFSELAAKRESGLLCVDPSRYDRAVEQTVLLTALLYGLYVVIADYNVEHEMCLKRLSESLGLAFVTCGQDTPVRVKGLVLEREVPALTQRERAALFSALLPEEGLAGLSVEEAAGLYRMNPGQVAELAGRFQAELAAGDGSIDEIVRQRLFASAAAPSLMAGAKRLESALAKEDLILPAAQQKQFCDICAFARVRGRVYDEWGFGAKSSYGRGMSVLFYGPSGTGKTMAAMVMAQELGLALYRVDLSQMISKYIGETQKNIGRIFDEAGRCDCILFFDEADALFARRGEAADSQEKYSNAEIAYLLQRTEEYDGISVLATNLLQNFDEAFRRRIRYMLHFPQPDAALRERLWRRVFPAGAPLGEIDYSFLAEQFELSGAEIKNCALHAAHMAALDGVKIETAALLDAARGEYAKLGKAVSPQVLLRKGK